MIIDCSNRTVLVTGGTRGIGAAIVKTFLNSGAKVFFTGVAPENNRVLHSNAHYLSVDFSSDTSTHAFLNNIKSLEIDILINNAGINKISPFGDIQEEDWKRIQKVNVDAPFFLCKALAPKMAQKNFGRIVNVASIFSHVSKAFRGPYSASKFAIVGMTKALALEYGKNNVLANCVSPGFIDTELTRTVLKPNEIDALVAQVPMGRLGTPDEIANLVLFLASPLNSFITAQNILIDGGFTSA